VYRGRFDLQNFTTQIHDFDPGIHPYPDGLFWTIQIPKNSVEVHLGAGTASLRVDDLALTDFFDIPNALSNGALKGSSPATVSFDIHWSGVIERRQVRNADLHVAGLFLTTGASIRWTGTNAQGFTFTSDAAGQTVVSAQIGHERNGVFFS
jgi:hypothetical protein